MPNWDGYAIKYKEYLKSVFLWRPLLLFYCMITKLIESFVLICPIILNSNQNWPYWGKALKDSKIWLTVILHLLHKVFRKQVSCNASVWKTCFIQFFVQRLRECNFFDLIYLKLLLGKLPLNLWTKNTDFHYIKSG